MYQITTTKPLNYSNVGIAQYLYSPLHFELDVGQQLAFSFTGLTLLFPSAITRTTTKHKHRRDTLTFCFSFCGHINIFFRP